MTINEVLKDISKMDKEIYTSLIHSFNNEDYHLMNMFRIKVSKNELKSYFIKLDESIKHTPYLPSEVLIDFLYFMNNGMILYSDKDDVIMNITITIENNKLVFSINKDEINKNNIDIVTVTNGFLDYINLNLLRDEYDLNIHDIIKVNINPTK